MDRCEGAMWFTGSAIAEGHCRSVQCFLYESGKPWLCFWLWILWLISFLSLHWLLESLEPNLRVAWFAWIWMDFYEWTWTSFIICLLISPFYVFIFVLHFPFPSASNLYLPASHLKPLLNQGGIWINKYIKWSNFRGKNSQLEDKFLDSSIY